jgi:hypothetical protein
MIEKCIGQKRLIYWSAFSLFLSSSSYCISVDLQVNTITIRCIIRSELRCWAYFSCVAYVAVNKMNRTFTRRYIKGLLVVWILTLAKNYVYTDPGRDFLTAVISRLKQERPVENHHLFYDELLKATSRSADEYQIQESQRVSIKPHTVCLKINPL